jgi:nucleotide-binding universal stress UspA family protein
VNAFGADWNDLMQRILAATDFSTRSGLAVRRAGLLARRSDAELTLLHVVNDNQPSRLVEMERREAGRILDEQIVALAELRNVRCRLAVTAGQAADGILQAAQAASSDLVVMGGHRRRLLSQVVRGTTPERVIGTGSVPVLMVNTDAAEYRSVMAALDMTGPSARAITTAHALGLLDDVHVTVVHAFQAWARGKMLISDIPQATIDRRIAEEQREASAEVAAFLKSNGLCDSGWLRRVEEGSTAEVISRMAQELRADLVVLGRRDRSSIARLMWGSVVEKSLGILETDVLVVPPVRDDAVLPPSDGISCLPLQ